MNPEQQITIHDFILKTIRYYPDGKYCWKCGEFHAKSHSLWDANEIASPIYKMFIKDFSEDPRLKFYEDLVNYLSDARVTTDPTKDAVELTEGLCESVLKKWVPN